MQYSTPLIQAIYQTQLGSSGAKLVAINFALAAYHQGQEFSRRLCDLAQDTQMSERASACRSRS